MYDYDDSGSATVRSFELGYWLGRHHARFTPKQLANWAGLSPSGAFRLLQRASKSKRVRMQRDRHTGEWYVPSPVSDDKKERG